MPSELVEEWLTLDDAECREELEHLDHGQRRYVRRDWRHWAHPGQLPPEGPWHTWLIMAGRGYGKTRAGGDSVFYKPTA